MYEATPLELTPQKAAKILEETFKIESMFNDYQPACPELCGQCILCMRRKYAIASNIWNPRALAYEVWKGAEFVGIMYVRDIQPGHDALAEFTFWDEDLLSKSTIINQVLEKVVFNGQLGLHRVTVEVPYTRKLRGLHRFLLRKLGFMEEGTKREAMLYNGEWVDVKLYGKLANAGRITDTDDAATV